MATIILTEPGERIFEPFFGVDFRTINLNQPAQMVSNEARMRIAVALKKWEKRVQVDEVQIEITKTEDDILVLKIQVFFIDPNDIKNIQDLLIYKSLGPAKGKTMPF
jgi:phage baseplate assembly protein W